jgi:hypothetical protein
MSRCTLALIVGAVAAVAADAQTVRTPVAPAPVAVADLQKLQAIMMAAQAAAVRPGDDALPCEALHKELVSSMGETSVQAVARSNPALAKELAAREKTKAPMTAEQALALSAALSSGMAMPGAGVMAGVPPVQPTTPQQVQQAMAVQQQAMVAYMNQVAPIMPTLMRSQRLAMLGTMKGCGWAMGTGLNPGVGVPR